MHFNLNLDQISDSGDLNSETEICRLYYDQKEIFNFRFVASGLKKIQIDDLGATLSYVLKSCILRRTQKLR